MLMTPLMAVVPSPGVRVSLPESLIHSLGRVSEWCDLWGMKLNASKTKAMIVSGTRTMHPQSPPLRPSDMHPLAQGHQTEGI